MDSDIQHQIELAAFPSGVQVTHFPEGTGQVFCAEENGRGLEILLTNEAAKMYGEGPSVSLVLTMLRRAAAKELPPALPDGTFERTVFRGD
ncbi:hypothetical protein Dxin01_03263 [Deinococcus xinjiangensis]|uniref:Uncharacterized protein n=1 Tax=Deinococcus xinjiangensis TaxID=457454 RepID=A0ABP9VE37_9DEIO